jgi:hypothetical protein
MRECDQLNNYLKTLGLNPTWWDRVKEQKQDPWEQLRANDINNQMRQFQIKVQGAK